MTSTKNKYRGAIIGTAIGDALGAPMEMMLPDMIAKLYPDFDDYVISKREGISEGQWTDDTQLMIPIIWSIIYKDGIDPMDIADQYITVSKEEFHRGWGGSTTESIDKLSEGCYWFDASHNVFGEGNGAAMKAAPLGMLLFDVACRESRLSIRNCINSIIDIGKITHKKQGIACGLLQCALISMAAFEYDKATLEQIKFLETEFFGQTTFSDRIGILVQYDSVKDIAKSGGVSPLSLESWATTAAVWLKINDGSFSDPIATLFELIKQGGDCDTTGAMLGALIGARFGYNIFPARLIKGLEDSDKLLKMADRLYESVDGATYSLQQTKFKGFDKLLQSKAQKELRK